MNIEMILQDNEKGTLYDISNAVGNIVWTTQLEDQPGKLTFEYYERNLMLIHEGSPISFKVDDKGVFFGYVFTKQTDGTKKYSITAYDQLFYLKNKDTYVFNDMTASDIFKKICEDKQRKYRIATPSKYKLASIVEDNKTLFSMVQGGIDKTFVNTGNWYTIYDDFGTLVFTTINSLKSLLVIGDDSLANGFSFKSSIEEDTYNQVKLIKENKEAKKREVYIVKDSNNIKKWGLLQYFEKMDEKANEAQIKERASMILKLKNRVTKSLSIPCIGDTSIFAGVGVVISIDELVKEGIPKNKYFAVLSATHTFQNDNHTMKLEVQVSI